MTSFLLDYTDLKLILIENSRQLNKPFPTDENIKNVMIGILEEFLTGHIWSSLETPRVTMASMGYLNKEADDLLDFFKDALTLPLRVFTVGKEREDDDDYIVTAHPGNKLIVSEVKVIQVKPDPIKQLKEQMLNDLENGDYYPERLRQLIGSLS